jgi:hypothetical protein
MKKTLLILLLAFNSLSYAEEQKQNTVTETTKSVISGIVKFGKDLIEGVDEGVDEGRKTGLSQDGAILIDNGTDLENILDIKLLGVKKEDETTSSIEIGFKNNADNPVRLINLRESENVIAIDMDGFATNLSVGKGNPIDVTIPSKAGKKQEFKFDLPPDSVKEIRIMGKVYTR